MRRGFKLGLEALLALCLTVAQGAAADRPTIGFLSSASPGPFAHLVDAFREGLAGTGHVEGETVEIVYRWAEGDYDRLPDLANELVAQGVDVILASGGDRPSLAAQQATAETPIVFAGSDAPVQLGLVESLSRPGGNITGGTLFTSEVEIKKLELLHEVLPDGRRIGMLVNPNNPTAEADARAISEAAASMSLELDVIPATSAEEIASAFTAFAGHGLDGILIGHDPFFNNQRDQIVALVDGLGLPAVYEHRAFVAAGGLMSYGNIIDDNYRLAGEDVGRILNGERPGDLPVRQASTFELVINQAAADRLGFAIPQSVLIRADEILE